MAFGDRPARSTTPSNDFEDAIIASSRRCSLKVHFNFAFNPMPESLSHFDHLRGRPSAFGHIYKLQILIGSFDWRCPRDLTLTAPNHEGTDRHLSIKERRCSFLRFQPCRYCIRDTWRRWYLRGFALA